MADIFDGYPSPPADASYQDLQRYAGILVYAEILRRTEAEDHLTFMGLGKEPTPTPPAELWAKAERLYDEQAAAKAERDRNAAALAAAAAASPELARAAAAFEGAMDHCRTGHPAGCTFGGLTPSSGYWMASEACELPHGETCQIRLECDGAEATAAFSDWHDGWIWRVFACHVCATAWRTAQPGWVLRGSGETALETALEGE